MSYYLGPAPSDRAAIQNTIDEYVGDGSRSTFLLSQEVTGNYSGSISVFVNSVYQIPNEAYSIENATRLIGASVGTFQLGETVTGGTSGATAAIIDVTSKYVVVSTPTGYFQTAETITGAISTATQVINEIETLYGSSLEFTDPLDNNDEVTVNHLGTSTYKLQPAARSVGPEELQENLREFSVDTFTGNGATAVYTLSQEIVSDNAVLVSLDGVIQNGTTSYTIVGDTLTFSENVPNDVVIRVLHLGFTTTARRSVIDGSITNAKIDPNFVPTTDTFPTPIRVGQEVWRTDLEAFFKWNGTAWIEI